MVVSADVLLLIGPIPLTPKSRYQSSGWRDWFREQVRWLKRSMLSPSVRRPPAAPSSSNTAPSFELEDEEEEAAEDPEPLGRLKH